jgi:hypothetical protein
MNPTNTNVGGYPASEMRKYLAPVSEDGILIAGSGKFLAGLSDAGVPINVLWGPARVMSEKNGQTIINDLLWLPTEREMFPGGKDADSNGPRSIATDETAQNQARLEYYVSDSSRRKAPPAGGYWIASADSGSAVYFCYVADSRTAVFYAEAEGGVAPAFCVR